MKKLESHVSLMYSKRNKAVYEDQLAEIDSIISGYEKSYYKLFNEQSRLLNLSAETLANSLVSDFIIHQSFYQDSNLNRKIFSLEDILDLEDSEISETIRCYREISDLFIIKNIKKIAVSQKIRDFVKNSSNAESFFGRSGSKLTQNQVNLFDYSKYFISLFEHIKDISDEDKLDPDEVERAFIMEMNSKKNKNQDTSGNLKAIASSLKAT
jgi:hypothetical protein